MAKLNWIKKSKRVWIVKTKKETNYDGWEIRKCTYTNKYDLKSLYGNHCGSFKILKKAMHVAQEIEDG